MRLFSTGWLAPIRRFDGFEMGHQGGHYLFCTKELSRLVKLAGFPGLTDGDEVRLEVYNKPLKDNRVRLRVANEGGGTDDEYDAPQLSVYWPEGDKSLLPYSTDMHITTLKAAQYLYDGNMHEVYVWVSVRPKEEGS